MMQSAPASQGEEALRGRQSWDPVDMITPSSAHAQEISVESAPVSSLLAPRENITSDIVDSDRSRSAARSIYGFELGPEKIAILFTS